MEKAKHAQGGVGQRRETLCQPGTLGVVTVFVPPAIFDEVQAIFHLPMATNIVVQGRGTDCARIATGDEVPSIVEHDGAIGRSDFMIGAKENLAARKIQGFANILGIVQVEPQPTGFDVSPLFP